MWYNSFQPKTHCDLHLSLLFVAYYFTVNSFNTFEKSHRHQSMKTNFIQNCFFFFSLYIFNKHKWWTTWEPYWSHWQSLLFTQWCFRFIISDALKILQTHIWAHHIFIYVITFDNQQVRSWKLMRASTIFCLFNALGCMMNKNHKCFYSFLQM